jgi:copper(I)-binding protein
MKAAVLVTALVAVSLGCRIACAAERPFANDAWARATPPGIAVGAAYLTITGGSADDTLIGARLDGVGRIEFHQTVTADGVARMRPATKLAVPARERVAFAPGGRHLMLIDLARPLAAGEKRTLVLVLERAGEISVELDVRPASASTPDAH